jgi:hypothetical protein
MFPSRNGPVTDKDTQVKEIDPDAENQTQKSARKRKRPRFRGLLNKSNLVVRSNKQDAV